VIKKIRKKEERKNCLMYIVDTIDLCGQLLYKNFESELRSGFFKTFCGKR